MLSVRVQGQNYRIGNETLDRLFGAAHWRRQHRSVLESSIREHHRGGRLVIDRQRLRIASPLEDAESRLRAEDSRDEILRWGFLRIAAGLAQIADEIRALPISARSQDVEQLEARLRSARPEASDQFDSSAAKEKLTRDTSEDLVEDRSTIDEKATRAEQSHQLRRSGRRQT
jgi:hypothetical protein